MNDSYSPVGAYDGSLFNDYVGSTSEWIWETNALGRQTFANAAVTEMLGYEPEELIGIRWVSMIHPEDRKGVRTLIREAVDKKSGWANHVARVRGKDGTYRWLDTSATPYYDEQYGGIGFRGTVRDVTSRKHAEDQLRLAYEHERELVSRLQDLDRQKADFIAAVSHDLRTPLTSIVGYIEMMQDGEFGDISTEQQEVLERVQRNTKTLLGLVGNLLTAAQIEADSLVLNKGVIDLEEILTNALESMSMVASTRQISLDIQIAKGIPNVAGDAGQLVRLVDNLLGNALKFTPEGGNVTITLEKSDQMVVFSVADTGIGIEEGDIGRLFDRFFRSESATSSAASGSGLGLSIAKSIVDAHGGTISVESTPGEGSIFTVALPVSH